MTDRCAAIREILVSRKKSLKVRNFLEALAVVGVARRSHDEVGISAWALSPAPAWSFPESSWIHGSASPIRASPFQTWADLP